MVPSELTAVPATACLRKDAAQQHKMLCYQSADCLAEVSGSVCKCANGSADNAFYSLQWTQLLQLCIDSVPLKVTAPPLQNQRHFRYQRGPRREVCLDLIAVNLKMWRPAEDNSCKAYPANSPYVQPGSEVSELVNVLQNTVTASYHPDTQTCTYREGNTKLQSASSVWYMFRKAHLQLTFLTLYRTIVWASFPTSPLQTHTPPLPLPY